MSVSVLVIRPGVFDVLETRCTFFSLRSDLQKDFFVYGFACGLRASRTGMSLP